MSYRILKQKSRETITIITGAMMAVVMIVTVMYSTKWTKVEVTRIVGVKGQKIPGKTMLELKTNCARSKTFMRAEGRLGVRRERKLLEKIYGFKVLGNGPDGMWSYRYSLMPIRGLVGGNLKDNVWVSREQPVCQGPLIKNINCFIFSYREFAITIITTRSSAAI